MVARASRAAGARRARRPARSGDDPTPAAGGPSSPRATDTRTPPTPDLARFYDQQLDWRDCKDGFECARLLVPVDYTDPDGATLEVAVNRLPASGDRIGSLVVNPGGPGVSGLEYARSAQSIVSKPVRDAVRRRGLRPARGRCQRRTAVPRPTRSSTPSSPTTAHRTTPAEEQGLVAAGASCSAAVARGRRPCCCRTSAPATPRATSTSCGPRSATGGSPTSARATAPTSGRCTPSCSRSGSVGWCWTAPIDPTASNLEVARLQAVGFERALDVVPRRLPAAVGPCPFDGDRAAAEARLGAFLDEVDRTPLPGVGTRS